MIDEILENYENLPFEDGITSNTTTDAFINSLLQDFDSVDNEEERLRAEKHLFEDDSLESFSFEELFDIETVGLNLTSKIMKKLKRKHIANLSYSKRGKKRRTNLNWINFEERFLIKSFDKTPISCRKRKRSRKINTTHTSDEQKRRQMIKYFSTVRSQL